MILRIVTAGLLTGGIALTGSGAALAAPVPAEPPVSLVVGLRPAPAQGAAGAAVVDKLEDSVDVVDSEQLTGAVAVDVPAGQVADAAASLRANPAVAYVEQDHLAGIDATTPNDPAFRQQWGLARANLGVAWDTTRGSGDIVVAVVDTGVKPLPDFASRLLPGYDFVNKDSDPTDDHGHGTMAAGVAAASGNNGTGIAGVCWSCKILPVKALNAKGLGTYSDIAESVRWSADHGADIINLSLGGTADSQLMRDAVTYAMSKGALVLAAAGNEGSPAPHYPAAIPDVLAVGGSTATDTRYPWSNYGSSWVDLAAPGCNPAQGLTGALTQFCGTSSATPFAAGVAALLASTTPAPDAAAIRAALTSSATKISGSWVAGSAGRVDAAAAIAALPAPGDTTGPATSFVTPSASAFVRGTVPVTAKATDNVGIAKVELLANGVVVGVDRVAPYAFSWRPSIRSGSVALGLRAYDRGGNIATAARQVRVDNAGPAVRITSGPANGARKLARTVRLAAQSSDASGIRSMELLINGKVAQRYAGVRRTFTIQTTKYPRTMKVQVRAYDRAGNAAFAPTRTWRR